MRNPHEIETPVANITPFGLRLQPGLKRRVDEAARANGRSINAEIAARLEASFADNCTGAGGGGLEGRVADLERSHIVLLGSLGDLAERLEKISGK